MTVPGAGYARMGRHRGVPACQGGDPIQVRARSGTTPASATFRMHHNWPGRAVQLPRPYRNGETS